MVVKKYRSSSAFCRLALSLFAAIAASFLHNPTVSAQGNRSLIFVVDSSEKMAPYLPSVKGTILTYVDQSTKGDSLGIIAFSNVPKLITDKKVSGPSDRKSLEVMIDAVTAGGAGADIARGVERALEEVATLKRKGDKSVKGIIVISASTSPEGTSTGETLEKALQETSRLVDASEWYIQYCYLNGESDSQVERFVATNNGLSYDVDALKSEHGVETIAELYRITSTPERLYNVRAADIRGAALGKKSTDGEWVPLKVGDNVTEGTQIKAAGESQVIIALGNFGKLGLAPESDLTLLRSRSSPVTGRAELQVSLETGSIWTHLAPKPETILKASSAATTAELSGKVDAAVYFAGASDIGIASFSDALLVGVKGAEQKLKLGVNQSTRLGAGQTIAPAEPAPTRFVEEWKSWSKALTGNTQLAALQFAIPQVSLFQEKITLGPIKSGAARNWTFPLKITGVSDISKLKIATEISLQLPKGLFLSTAIIDGNKTGAKALLVKLDGSEGFRSGRMELYQGLLKISPAPDSGILFEKTTIPLAITAKGPLVPRPVVIFGAAALILGAIAYVATFKFRAKASVRLKPHRVIGRLVVIEDPTGGRIGSINLEDVSTKSSRLSLVIGRDKTAEVRLKHTSVKPEHCFIEANLVANRLETYIEPIESAKVVVDGEAIKSRTQLTDGAKIGIGDFTYQFEDSQMYKRVDVIYSNGRRISGMLDVQGIDGEGFRISPMDAVSPSERARVRFSDIRCVTFYRRTADILSGTPRPTPKAGATKRVELMFKKGETISGLVQREYTEGRKRYIELLPLDSSSAVDYTVVDCGAIVEKKIL